ncbi:LacI family DNA-binding transcriptional regulator [Dactylosporangium siamense]|uniref:LacI family transcriptional regulator n=1 Tax=Dactylosporangium siamense TaxID=685454 RepID=A0A919PW64_9ACTN|nr:LacI family DNA-binding transcriptional regulator [Dactylosporangium siamense]GIG51382.1 LacI family transcriptional regulator [Dactylosporangium siamense]
MGRRVTQRDIARMTGVSQATVSLVLNDTDGSNSKGVRIAQDTRQRVLDAIRATGYVADVVGRRLADRSNRILGVFTYEPVFPSATADFYHPFLVGIEQRAEQLGCDLLLFTSGPHRMRLADGCIVLGRSIGRDELARLVAEHHPFVSVGRRDSPDVPYVGADYGAATAALVGAAVGLGHRRLAYVGTGGPAESHLDRLRGFADACLAAGVYATHEPRKNTLADAIPPLLADGVTALFLEEPADAAELIAILRGHGRDVPADVSVVVLGEPTRAGATPPPLDVTRFRTPRREMGWQAVDHLTEIVGGGFEPGPARQTLLACELVPGETLGTSSDISSRERT